MSLGKRNVLYLRVYLDFFGGACKVVKAMVRKSIRAAIFQHAMSDLFYLLFALSFSSRMMIKLGKCITTCHVMA